MSTLHAEETDGTEPVPAAALDELDRAVLGTVIRPRDASYESARKIWNGMIDRHPGAIVRCRGALDVIASINFARERDLPVAVRGGAHSAAGHSVCDGGIVIDLGSMVAVRVDPQARTARAQGGALWADFDRETGIFDLATTGGMVSNTGIGGLTLGGGIGWLMGTAGLTCDNILSADVVTADGELIVVNEHENPDLLWALKGGGGNFGIAVTIEYSLHAVEPQVLGGMVLHRREDAREVMRFYRDYCRSLPDEAEAELMVVTDVDTGEPLVGMLLGYNGPMALGEKVLAPAREFGRPIDDQVAPMSYAERQCLLDGRMADHGFLRYWKSGLTPDLSDDFIDVILDHAASSPSRMSFVGIFYVHGAAARVDPQATAFGSRGDQWDVGLVSQWSDPADNDEQVAFTRAFWQDVEQYATNGVYVNHIANDEPHRVRLAFGPNYDRLLAVKAKYDPDNVFRLNHNIALG
jgi:FAD/FMN-containing dehydrogenase